MATSPNTIKNWFRTGLKPTQAQFWAWVDSFRHKDEAVPVADVSGLQELLDTKVDKKELVQPDQVGPYDPLKVYVYDAAVAEYVSYANPQSTNPQYQVEGFYRLRENAPAGENPETHPAHWVYQGTVLGDIAIEDVVGLREELDWLSENAGGDASSRSYTLDFGATGEIIQEINMLGAVAITGITLFNVQALYLTNSGHVKTLIQPGLDAFEIPNNEVNTWEIVRTVDDSHASVGVLIQIL